VKRISLLIATILLVANAAIAQDTRYNFDKNADFSKFKTYKWVALKDAAKPNELIDKQIIAAVDSELAVLGRFSPQISGIVGNPFFQSYRAAIEGLDPANPSAQADVWEKVVRKLRTGMMPPDGAPKPPDAVRETFTAALETSLDRVATRQVDPGAPALHRLNRTEYANVVRDLLALDVDVSALLPPDDAAAGFDNIADVLGVSPGLIEGYVAAAARISRLAIGDPSIGLDRVVYRVPGDLEQDVHVDGLPLGTRGGLVIRHTFPLDAEYDLQVGQAGGARLGGPPALGPRTEDLFVAIDGARVPLQGRGATRLRIAAGPHEIAAAPLVRSRTAGADGVFHVETRTPGITQVTISGPLNPTGPGDTPSRRRILICTPASNAEPARTSATATAKPRGNSGEAHIDLRHAKRRTALRNRRIRRPRLCDGVGVVLLGDRLHLGQGCVTLRARPRRYGIGAGALQVRGGLRLLGCVDARVDLVERLALAHDRAFAEQPPLDHARDLRPDIGNLECGHSTRQLLLQRRAALPHHHEANGRGPARTSATAAAASLLSTRAAAAAGARDNERHERPEGTTTVAQQEFGIHRSGQFRLSIRIASLGRL